MTLNSSTRCSLKSDRINLWIKNFINAFLTKENEIVLLVQEKTLILENEPNVSKFVME